MAGQEGVDTYRKEFFDEFGSKNHRFLEEKKREYSEKLRILLTPYEGKIMYLQGLLVWEIPHYSLLLFLVINGLFWLATCMRFYYLVGLTGFCVCSWELWTRHIWPEIKLPLPGAQDTEEWTPVHPNMLGVPEICRYLATFVVRIEYFMESARHLRQTQPAKFFLWAILLFVSVGAVGHYIKGIYIVYSVVMGCLILPSVYYYSLAERLEETLNPLVRRMEDTMNIKRKRSKKGKKSDDKSKKAEFSDSDEEIESFVPQDISQLSLKPKASDTDEESSRHSPLLLTPTMPEVGGSRDVSDDDSTYGDLPSQMPSVLSVDDSMSNDFRLSDFPDNSSNSNNNQDLHFGGRIGSAEQEADTDDGDITLHEDTSVTSSAAAIAASLPDEGESGDEKAESLKRLQFVSQHFKESSDEDDESKLVRGLEFPDIETDNQPNVDDEKGAVGLLTTLAQGSGQQMGAFLAGAFSGAQGTVSSMVASQMVTSIMENTVAGISRLSGAHKPSDLSAESSVKVKAKERVKLEGQGSRDSDAEFEFLNQEDFESMDADG